MDNNSFKFKKLEGKNFAKISGDHNAIHVDENFGYNSIYGENIVHGVFVLFKFLKKIKFKENFSYIKILFIDTTKYNYKVNIRKINIHKEKKIYELIQLNNVIARIELGFFFEDIKIEKLKKISIKKKYLINKKKENKFNFKNTPTNLNIALCNLSKYVGMYFPGENSIISEINIYKVNIEEEPEIAGLFGVRSIPAMSMIRANGNSELSVGSMTKDQLKYWLAGLISK